MTDFKDKMHQIRFRLGLRPRPRWGSLQHSLRLSSWIWGPLRGRGGAGEEEGKGREGEVEGREREGPELLLNQRPSEPCYATDGMLQLDSCPDLAVAIPLCQSSHVCIGCRFVNESPSRRRYWCGKLSTVQLRCICRTSVFQWPRCQVDSIYTVGDCWSPDGSKGSDDNRPAELCRQRADRLEQFTSCSASIGGVQASSEKHSLV